MAKATGFQPLIVMIEAPIPQDILKYKAKFIGNFSTRETICLGTGIIGSVAGYLTWFSGFENGTVRSSLAFVCALIPIAFGFIRPYEMPLEKAILYAVVENYIWPAKRLKETRHPEYEKYENKKSWELYGEIDEDSRR